VACASLPSKSVSFFNPPFRSFKWFLGLGSFIAACVFSLDLHLPEGEREEGKRKSSCCNVECGQLEEDADPYLNTDAGTMSPFEHGEVFVLDDGGEVCSHLFSNTLLDLP
jgi:hypothetical protein